MSYQCRNAQLVLASAGKESLAPALGQFHGCKASLQGTDLPICAWVSAGLR